MVPDFSTQEFIGAAVALVAAGIGLAKYIVSRFDRKVDAIMKTMERDKAELNARMDRDKAELNVRIDREKKEILTRIAESDARNEKAFAMIVAQLQELHHRSGVLEGMAARPAMAPQPRELVAAQAVPDSLEDSKSEDQ